MISTSADYYMHKTRHIPTCIEVLEHIHTIYKCSVSATTVYSQFGQVLLNIFKKIGLVWP